MFVNLLEEVRLFRNRFYRKLVKMEISKTGLNWFIKSSKMIRKIFKVEIFSSNLCKLGRNKIRKEKDINSLWNKSFFKGISKAIIRNKCKIINKKIRMTSSKISKVIKISKICKRGMASNFRENSRCNRKEFSWCSYRVKKFLVKILANKKCLI